MLNYIHETEGNKKGSVCLYPVGSGRKGPVCLDIFMRITVTLK